MKSYAHISMYKIKSNKLEISNNNNKNKKTLISVKAFRNRF